MIKGQLYFFIWYICEVFGFDSDALDNHLENKLGINLEEEKKRKKFINMTNVSPKSSRISSIEKV